MGGAGAPARATELAVLQAASGRTMATRRTAAKRRVIDLLANGEGPGHRRRVDDAEERVRPGLEGGHLIDDGLGAGEGGGVPHGHRLATGGLDDDVVEDSGVLVAEDEGEGSAG